jgi:hypothetical protein
VVDVPVRPIRVETQIRHDVAKIAAGLSLRDRAIILREGICVGRMPFSASLMRPLERRGIFVRVERKGFQVRWQLTPLGEDLWEYFTERDHA